MMYRGFEDGTGSRHPSWRCGNVTPPDPLDRLSGACFLLHESDAERMQRAVLRNEQGSFVWVIGPDGKAQPRPVVTAHWVGADWVIREGLANGDRVIVDNLIKVRPGMAVQARPAAPAPAAAGMGGAAPAKDAAAPGKDAAPSPARAN